LPEGMADELNEISPVLCQLNRSPHPINYRRARHACGQAINQPFRPVHP
jgi:hypothetical protein